MQYIVVVREFDFLQTDSIENESVNTLTSSFCGNCPLRFYCSARSSSFVLVWEMELAEKLQALLMLVMKICVRYHQRNSLTIMFKVSRLNRALITGLAVLGHCHYSC
jgi:hypothetical protein